MSQRDQELVRATGRSVAQIAEVLDKTRQTVARGIKKDDDYFALPDLVSLVRHFEGVDRGVARGILEVACGNYPELASGILAAVAKSTGTANLGSPGEYWFICADLTTFRARFSSCLSFLHSLQKNDTASLIVFTRPTDKKSADRLFSPPGPYNNVHTHPCNDIAIGGLPSMLLHKAIDGSEYLYVCGYDGFVSLPSEEAARIADFVSDNLLSEPA